MESQRVVLLTECYLRGWLDFERKQRGSAARESFILNYLERHKLEEVLKMDALTASVMASGILTSDIFQRAKDARLKYFNAVFPYVKMDKKNAEVTVEETAFWRDFLNTKSKDLA